MGARDTSSASFKRLTRSMESSLQLEYQNWEQGEDSGAGDGESAHSTRHTSSSRMSTPRENSLQLEYRTG